MAPWQDGRTFVHTHLLSRKQDETSGGISLSLRSLLCDEGKRQQTALSCDQSAELKDREEASGKSDGYLSFIIKLAC